MSRSLIPSSLSLSLRSEFFAPGFGHCLIEFLAPLLIPSSQTKTQSRPLIRPPPCHTLLPSPTAAKTNRPLTPPPPRSRRLPTSTTEQKDDDTATHSSTATCATQEAMGLTAESSKKTAAQRPLQPPPVSSAKQLLPIPTPLHRPTTSALTTLRRRLVKAPRQRHQAR
ncbi:hypothetical protein C8J56DRAFT_245542 [Mycena floridula]|nr:hypothetical protein C8J56DRAFT_245542 [Mycena floridula]